MAFIKDGQITPREYQTNIANAIMMCGNTLVVLPTGLGKTIIAILLFDKVLAKKHTSKILFLAPTKPLVQQHAETITKLTNIEPCTITGTLSPKKRVQLILAPENQIIIATPQTIGNDLKHLPKDLFDLIVFDECHKAQGSYAYVACAQHFENALKVGMSASPGTSKSEVKEVMNNLGLKNIELRTETDEDVSPYLHDTNIYWIKISLPDQMKEVNKLLNEFVLEKAQTLIKMGYYLRKGFTQTEVLAMQKRISADINKKNPLAYSAASTVSTILKINHAIILLETQGVKSVKSYFERMLESENQSKANITIQKDEKIQRAKYILEGLDILDTEHPKIKKLEELILKELNERPQSKIIVFNQYRDSITNLEKKLNANPLICAKRFIGQASKGNDKGMNQDEQKQIIDEFKEGKYNVLLATSVAEEGLDIPNVDTVFFFEPVPSDIRSIQRRGRTGRFNTGTIYVMITEGTRDEIFHWASRKKEKTMKDTLSGLSLKKQDTVFEKIKKIEEINGNGILPAKEKSEIKQKLLTDLIKKDNSVKNENENEKEEKEITIVVDNRERHSKAFEELKKKDCKIIETNLSIGDYQVGEDCIIERKSVSDFINSLLDGRLFNQAIKMTAFEKSLLIIEGNFEYVFEERDINKSAILGAIFSLLFEFRIPILFSVDCFETADLIFALAKREQTKKDKLSSVRHMKKTNDLHLIQRFVLEGFPHIGPTIAERVIKEYTTLNRFFNTSLERLEKIEGIGDKKAKMIWDIIYNKTEEEKK